jgi:hypothetical protein
MRNPYEKNPRKNKKEKKKLKGHVKIKGPPTSDNEKKIVTSGGGNLYSSMYKKTPKSCPI